MVEVSEFKEKSDLINELLGKMDLDFKDNMTREERESLDVERQMLVLRAEWNNMSVPELKALLEPKPAEEDVKRKKEIHPIFHYLKDLMKEKPIYDCFLPDSKIDITIFSYPDPSPIMDDNSEKYIPWIYVSVRSHGGRIEKLEEEFSFKYPEDGKWLVQLGGKINIKSAMTDVLRTFYEREKLIFAADYVEYWWLTTQLDALLELLKNAKLYHS